MTMRKFAALFLTIAMLVSAVGTTVLAADTVGFELKLSKDNVYVGDDFTVDLYVTLPASVTTLRQVQIDFTFNNEAIKLVKAADKTADAVKVEQAVTVTEAIPADYMLIYGQAKTASSVSYSVGYDYSIEQTGTFANMTSGKIYSFSFVALAEGDMNITATAFTWQYGAGDTDKNTLAGSTATDSTASGMKVQVMPVAPTATINTPAFTGEVVEGGTGVKPSYAWNNGNQGADAVTNNGDASVVTWYAGDDSIGTTVADAAFVIPAAAVGKTLSYTVLPKVDRTIAPEGTLSAKTTVGMVKAIASYLPTVASATLPAELIATISVEPTVVLDNTYALAEDASTYVWHVVEAADAEAAVAAISAENKVAETKAYAPLVADRDKYAVVVVTPVVTVAGETRTGTETTKVAALIKGEPPVIDASGIDTEVKLTVGRTLKTDAVEIDAKMPEGAEGTQEAVTTYAWYALDVNTAIDSITEETEKVGEADKLKLTSDMKDKKIVLLIDYTNELGIPAETAVVSYAGVVQKASGSATQGGTSLVGGGTTTPVDPEKPGTDEPADEKDPADPAGTANDKGAAVFTDVDKEAYAWAYEGIDALTKSGVIKGMTETTFGPELTATNAQMIALAVRIAGLTAEDAKTDKVDAEHWVAAELAVADAKGILSVYGDKIDVEAATTREVAFTLLYNALKAAGVELPADAEAIEFTDAASIDANCVEAIDALVKAGIVNGMGDGTLAPKATLTRAQLAKILGMANAIIAK